MKKIISLVLIGLLTMTLTGCGEKKVTCKATEGDSNASISLYGGQDGYVTKISGNVTMIAPSAEEAKQYYDEIKNEAKENGYSVKRNGKQITMSFDIKNTDKEDFGLNYLFEITLDDAVEELEDEGYSCK